MLPDALDRPGRQLDDLVQPGDRCAVAGVPVGLQLGVPGGAEQACRACARTPRPSRGGDQRAQPLLADHDVAVRAGGRAERAAAGEVEIRSPSYPSLGSSVTSKRSIDQDRSAAAIRVPVPGLPVQAHSARSWPGEAGCAVQVER